MTAAVLEQFDIIGGHRIPRWDFLTFEQAKDCWVSGCHQDRYLRCPLRRLDDRVRETFDEKAWWVTLVDGELTTQEDMEALFLLQVPEWDSLENPEEPGPVPDALQGLPGALLFDSRIPGRIPQDIPVITDPRQAWAVLLRTTEGVFLPDADPVPPPKSFRDLAGNWLVGRLFVGRPR